MTILPKSLLVKEFVNADEIAKGLSPFNPEGVAIEAGRLMLERIKYLINKEESFSIETTLATRSYINLVMDAHKRERIAFGGKGIKQVVNNMEKFNKIKDYVK